MILPGAARAGLRLAIVVFASLALLPIVYMLATSFVAEGRLNFDAYRDVLVEKRQWSLLGTTVAMGLLGTGGAILLGLPFAFLIARTEFPLRRLFSTLYIVPLLTPPLILAWGWTRTPDWFVLSDLKGLVGCAFVFALCYYPFIVLLAARAFRSIDAGIEEAARLAGGRWRTILAIQTRLALPAILSGALISFIFIISDFSLPDFVSTLGPKQNVYAGEIFFRSKRLESTSQATAASIPLVLLTVGALLLIFRLRGHRSSATVSGDFRPPARHRLGAKGWLATLYCSFVIGVSVLAPFGSLVAQARGIDAFRKAITNPGARSDILASLGTSAAAATCMTILGFLLAYTVVRLAREGKRRRSAWLEGISILPLAIPALMIGIGFIRIWNRPHPFFDTVYTTQWMLFLVLIARYIPFAVIALAAGLRQIDANVEEAGALVGAPFRTRITKLLFPLVRSSAFAAWILTFIFSMRELDTMVLLPAGGDSLAFRVFNEIHFGRDPEVAAICMIMVFLISLPLVVYCLLTAKRLDPLAP